MYFMAPSTDPYTPLSKKEMSANKDFGDRLRSGGQLMVYH